ncbi:MAG: hypothetical protein ACI9LV_000819 [Candidatus Nanohaloarchaea archaeon]|jgi:hypothetical protein
MVEWKGRLEGEVGEKAQMLDRIERFPVPNFFVITSEELEQIFGGKASPEQILNTSIGSDQKKEIKDAYKDIGMSSEVRNATGRAKNLVGGQRNNQLVSVRASENGVHSKYRLNVGSSDLFDAIKQVSSSYYEKEQELPSLVVQKMVEPEFSGSAVTGRHEDPDLVEVVEGLGTSLEEGGNQPYFYTRDSGEIDSKKPDEHLKVTRNPINGGDREKKVEPELPFDEAEISELLGKLDSEGLNIKFAYKRGDFHIVDAWKEDPEHEVLKNPEIQGVKVSEGDISGTVGQEITYSEETLPPEEYRKHLVARTGGYTSRDAEKAREEGKTAVFSFAESLEPGQRINMQQESPERKNRSQTRMDGGNQNSFPFSKNKERTAEKHSKSTDTDLPDSVLATQVLPLNPRNGKGVFTSPPYGEGYVLTDRPSGENEFSRENYVDSCEKAFRFEGEKLMLDVRKLGDEKKEVIDYLEAGTKVLIVGNPDTETLRKAVDNGFDTVACEERFMEGVETKMARAEKKFMVEKLQELE